jgi:hypothetical protein
LQQGQAYVTVHAFRAGQSTISGIGSVGTTGDEGGDNRQADTAQQWFAGAAIAVAGWTIFHEKLLGQKVPVTSER